MPVESLDLQNWLIFPIPGLSITPGEQQWNLILSGIVTVSFNGSDEMFNIQPDITAPLKYAINNYNCPIPGSGAGIGFQVKQSAPFVSINSSFNSPQSDGAFSVIYWHPDFYNNIGSGEIKLGNMFQGLFVRARRIGAAETYKIGFQINLVGIIFKTEG